MSCGCKDPAEVNETLTAVHDLRAELAAMLKAPTPVRDVPSDRFTIRTVAFGNTKPVEIVGGRPDGARHIIKCSGSDTVHIGEGSSTVKDTTTSAELAVGDSLTLVTRAPVWVRANAAAGCEVTVISEFYDR